MKARKKTIEVMKPDALGVIIEARLETLQVEEPPVRQGGVKVKSVEELVAGLQKSGVL